MFSINPIVLNIFFATFLGGFLIYRIIFKKETKESYLVIIAFTLFMITLITTLSICNIKELLAAIHLVITMMINACLFFLEYSRKLIMIDKREYYNSIEKLKEKSILYNT
ncbi:MAG: hypothetical protein Q4A42_05770 [Tissierellia bacterium]|nr:hypothetical protein [Tissierellia bacterium]